MRWLVAILFLIFVFSCQEKEEKCDNWKLLYNYENIDTLDIKQFKQTHQFIEYLETEHYYSGNTRSPSRYYTIIDSLGVNFSFDGFVNEEGIIYCGIERHRPFLKIDTYGNLYIPNIGEIYRIGLKTLMDSLKKRWNKNYNPLELNIQNTSSIDSIKYALAESQKASNQFVERTSTKRFNKSFCDLDSLQALQIKDSLKFDLMLLRKYKEAIPPPPKYSDNENN